MALSERDRRTVTIGGIVVGVLLAGFVLVLRPRRGRGGASRRSLRPRPGAGSPSPSPGGRRRRSRASPGGTPSPSRPPSPRPRRPTVPGGGGNGTERERDALSVERRRRRRRLRPRRHRATGPSQNVGGSTVVLLDVFQRDGATHVQVEVDGTVYDVVVGEQFASGQVRAPLGREGTAPRSSSATSQFTLCINAQKSAPATRPRGERSPAAGAALRAAPAPSESARWGPIRCCRAQDAHRRGVPREGARGHPRGHPGGRARGSEGDRGRARSAPPRARPRRTATPGDRRARHPERGPPRTDARLARSPSRSPTTSGRRSTGTSWPWRERAIRPTGSRGHARAMRTSRAR